MEECIALWIKIISTNHPDTLLSYTSFVRWQAEILEIAASADKSRSIIT